MMVDASGIWNNFFATPLMPLSHPLPIKPTCSGVNFLEAQWLAWSSAVRGEDRWAPGCSSEERSMMHLQSIVKSLMVKKDYALEFDDPRVVAKRNKSGNIDLVVTASLDGADLETVRHCLSSHLTVSFASRLAGMGLHCDLLKVSCSLQDGRRSTMHMSF